VRGDGAGLGSGAQEAHRARRWVDQHGYVVLIEHDHSDPERVEALAAQPGDLALLLLGDCRPPVVAGGFSEAPGRRALRPGRPTADWDQQTTDPRAAARGEQDSGPGHQAEDAADHAGSDRPLHVAIVGSLLTQLLRRIGQT
jgi:hypothetical protein